jgi:hypothetical protein
MLVRSMSTNKDTYETTVHDLGPIPSGQSRLTFYSSGGGPNLANPAGRFERFVIDDTTYCIGGDSYAVVDVNSGEHKIYYNTKSHAGLFGPVYIKGTDILKFESMPGEEEFFKFELKKATYFAENNNVLKFEIVPKEQALEEISTLKKFTQFDKVAQIKD